MTLDILVNMVHYSTFISHEGRTKLNTQKVQMDKVNGSNGCADVSNSHHNAPCITNRALQGGPKKLTPFVFYASISSNIDRFSNLFHCQNQENIYNNTVTKDPTTPQVCRYTTL